MRIPSQFNDESLYQRRPNQRDSGDTTRRLIRLALGLVLVVVVMRQAARPELYQAFFGTSPGQGSPVVGTVPVTQTTAAEQLGAAEVDPRDQAIARSLTQTLLPSDRQQWMVTLARWRTGRTIESVPSTIESIRSELSTTETGELDPQRQTIWQETLDSLQQMSASDEPTPPTDWQVVVLSAWLAALDESAAAKVVDGSTWRSGDFDLFFRYLDDASHVSEQNVVTTGVVPLLQQPDVYRTRRVRVVGTVARSEHVTAAENPFGITAYWQLWLRPSDGADRPLLAIVLDVPSVVSSVGPAATETEGPPVTMVGRYLKRLAYRSQKGADLAPVVVGRLLTGPAPVAPVAQLTESEGSGPLLWVVLLAILVGFSVAAIAMWRTGVTARRSRELRAAHQQPPSAILEQLGETTPEESE